MMLEVRTCRMRLEEQVSCRTIQGGTCSPACFPGNSAGNRRRGAACDAGVGSTQWTSSAEESLWFQFGRRGHPFVEFRLRFVKEVEELTESFVTRGVRQTVSFV